jgi:hypothetical protein
MLKLLNHDLIVHPPYYALFAMIEDAKLDPKSEISDYAAEILEDYNYTNALICYGPHIIAASALLVAARGNEHVTHWFGEIEADRKQISGRIAMIVDLYRSKKDLRKGYEELRKLPKPLCPDIIQGSPTL